jgi:signal peptidase I
MIRKLLGGTALMLVAVYVVVGFLPNHNFVSTPSMYPTIPPGSEIFVRPTNQVRVGEVIEFRANGLSWAHRLIKINADGSLVTKGDNPENAPDVFVTPLTRSNVFGVVTHAPRWLGFPELIAHRPGYGLAWLRTELGLAGKVALTILGGLVAYVLSAPGARSRKACHRATQAGPEVAADAITTPLDGLMGRTKADV